MERRRGAIAIVILLLVSVVVIQLTDPQFDERTPPEVDFSEPPNEIAADTATRFEYVNYAYKIELSNNESGLWRHIRTVEIDHTDREYYKLGPAGEDGIVLYGTDAVTFIRPGIESAWRVTPIDETVYSPSTISQPFLPERMRTSEATIISENKSFLVIKLQSHSLNVAEHFPGNSTIYVNKDEGLITRAYVTYRTPTSGDRHLRFGVNKTNVSLNRPEDIRFSLTEFVWDLLRGPVFSFG